MDDLFFRNVFSQTIHGSRQKTTAYLFSFLTFLFFLQTNRSVIPERRNIHTSAEGVAVMQTIRSTGKLEEETETKLKEVLGVYTKQFLDSRPV